MHPLWKQRIYVSFNQPREIAALGMLGLILGNIISVVTGATFTGIGHVSFLLVWTLTVIGTILIIFLTHVVDLLYTEEVDEDALIHRNMEQELRKQTETETETNKEMEYLALFQKAILSAATNGHALLAKEMTDVFQLMCTIASKHELTQAENQYITCILPNDFIHILKRHEGRTDIARERELDNTLLIVRNKKAYLQENYL